LKRYEHLNAIMFQVGTRQLSLELSQNTGHCILIHGESQSRGKVQRIF
jgi:hypothetical protein